MSCQAGSGALRPQERLDEVPVYAHPRHVISASGEVEAIEIVYITIYAVRVIL